MDETVYTKVKIQATEILFAGSSKKKEKKKNLPVFTRAS